VVVLSTCFWTDFENFFVQLIVQIGKNWLKYSQKVYYKSNKDIAKTRKKYEKTAQTERFYNIGARCET